jgi:hypothetical protein
MLHRLSVTPYRTTCLTHIELTHNCSSCPSQPLNQLFLLSLSKHSVLYNRKMLSKLSDSGVRSGAPHCPNQSGNHRLDRHGMMQSHQHPEQLLARTCHKICQADAVHNCLATASIFRSSCGYSVCTQSVAKSRTSLHLAAPNLCDPLEDNPACMHGS